MASALAALQTQLPLGPLLMPNPLGLGNLTGITPQDMNALQQAFQQVQQVSFHQTLQSYMELLHSSANSLGQVKNANSANAQIQQAAQFFQVSKSSYVVHVNQFHSCITSIKLIDLECERSFDRSTSCDPQSIL